MPAVRRAANIGVEMRKTKLCGWRAVVPVVAMTQMHKTKLCGSVWQRVAGCGRVWQAVAGCGSVWQGVAACGVRVATDSSPVRRSVESVESAAGF